MKLKGNLPWFWEPHYIQLRRTVCKNIRQEEKQKCRQWSDKKRLQEKITSFHLDRTADRKDWIV